VIDMLNCTFIRVHFFGIRCRNFSAAFFCGIVTVSAVCWRKNGYIEMNDIYNSKSIDLFSGKWQ